MVCYPSDSWLLVNLGILMFKTLHSLAPSYLSDWCKLVPTGHHQPWSAATRRAANQDQTREQVVQSR